MHQGFDLSRRGFLGVSTAALGALTVPAAFGAAPSKKLVLLAGKPSHGPMEHEFNAGILLLKKCLIACAGAGGRSPSQRLARQREGIRRGQRHSALRRRWRRPPLHPGRPSPNPRPISSRRGVGLMCVHYAVEVPKEKGGKEFQDWIGGYYEHMWSCNPMWTPEFTDLPKHAITRGVKPFSDPR